MLPTYRLVIKAGPNVGKSFTLEKSELFIGRDLGNDVVINDPEVSRRHARLVQQGDSYLLEDLGSTNGCFIRGQRLSGPYLLVPGDVLTFGERITLLYEAVTAASEAQTIPDSRREPIVQTPPVAPSQPISPPAAPVSYAPPPEPLAAPRPAPMPVAPPPQPIYQPVPPPQQPIYQPPAHPVYQQPPQPMFDPYAPVQPPYSGQVPMPPPAPTKKGTPAWMWVVIAILLLIVVVLVIDDFRLWYIFGLK